MALKAFLYMNTIVHHFTPCLLWQEFRSLTQSMQLDSDTQLMFHSNKCDWSA